MDNIPFKISTVNPINGIVINSYIFVGYIPDNISLELEKLEKNKKVNEKLLLQYYGKNWKKIFSVEKIGGNEDDYSLVDELDLDIIDEYESDVEDLGEDLDEDLDEDLGDGLDNTSRYKDKKIKPVINKTNHISGIKIIKDIDIYHFDSMFDVKKKFFTCSGIPFYRQHFYNLKNKLLDYNLLVSGNKRVVDINNLIMYYTGNVESDNIENIPIDSILYNNKEFINIMPLDFINKVSDFKKEGINEIFCIDLNDILQDRIVNVDNEFQLDMIYYGFIIKYYPIMTKDVFYKYIANENSLHTEYPLLSPDKNILLKTYKLEKEISNTQDNNLIIKNLNYYIKNTDISCEDATSEIINLLNLRSLFDFISLTDDIVKIKCNIIYDNNKLVLIKSESPNENSIFTEEKIIFTIKVDKKTTSVFNLIFYPDGKYDIITRWRNDQNISIKLLDEIVFTKVNKLIDIINDNPNLLFHNKKLVKITQNNMILTNTMYNYLYNGNININSIEEILNDFQKANIIKKTENTNEYYFLKGLSFKNYFKTFKNIYLDLKNIYSVFAESALTYLWDKNIMGTNIFKIENITDNDFSISISGIKNNYEFDVFNFYLMKLLTLHGNIKKNNKYVSKSKNQLKNLKDQDPKLYNFKEIYNSDIVYSKICQKPYQPILLNKKDYETLDKDLKSRAVKYKNITTNEDVWYTCPNPKFKYVKFIVNKHPKKYCIPCCKKTPMGEKINEKKREIHKICLSNYIYSDENDNTTKGINYISSFGKSIYPGRLSRLPETTLEPLLYDNTTEIQNVDSQYYLYGVEQSTSAYNYIGILYCITTSLDVDIDTLKLMIVKKLNKLNKFDSLLNGDIRKYFSNNNNLIKFIHTLDDKISTPTEFDINMLLKDILHYYFNITIIMFEKRKNVELHLPPNTSSLEEIINQKRKYIVVLKLLNNYYPIYLINKNVYFKTGIINCKVFEYNYGLITNISNIVEKYLNYSRNNFEIDLNTIKKFSTDMNIKIDKLYINFNNFCYAVSIKYKNEFIYFPISESLYDVDDIKSDFKPYKITNSYTNTISLCKLFNEWVYSNKLDTNLVIEMDHWLTHKNKILGFINNDVYFYFLPIDSKKIKMDKTYNLLYPPNFVNSIIYNSTYENKTRDKKIATALNKFYEYDLGLLHIISYINSHLNINLRNKIVNLFKKNKLKEIYNLYETISETDVEIIKKYINNKKTFLYNFEKYRFEFDKVEIEKIKSLPDSKLKDYFNDISKNIFIQSSVLKDISVSNNLVLCNNNTKLPHCSKSKMLIRKNTLNSLINNLVGIVKNKFLIEYIFDPFINYKYIDFYNFNIKDNEYVHIINNN